MKKIGWNLEFISYENEDVQTVGQIIAVCVRERERKRARKRESERERE